MLTPRLTKSELQIMNALWTLGPSSVREIQEALPKDSRLAYTTVQTMVSRLEIKKAVRRLKKVGNAFVFEAQVSRTSAHRRLIDDFLGLFGGRSEPVVAHLVDAGKLTLDDVREAERALRKLAGKDRS